MIGRILINGPARKELGLIRVAKTNLLFLLRTRRAGELSGHAAERLDARERTAAVPRQMPKATARRPYDHEAFAQRLRDGQF
ncbi:MAG: hypothetical protein ACK4MX_07235 [Thermaurantiacus sp.]